jgi:hypothetical protein
MLKRLLARQKWQAKALEDDLVVVVAVEELVVAAVEGPGVDVVVVVTGMLEVATTVVDGEVSVVMDPSYKIVFLFDVEILNLTPEYLNYVSICHVCALL